MVNQYLETVCPMHKQFIEPTERNADVILPHGANGPAVDIITPQVMRLLREVGLSFTRPAPRGPREGRIEVLLLKSGSKTRPRSGRVVACFWQS
ncbi:hypothetical protein [Inhella proteolytica]|uniref:hypothetical protein n=1 Tax=Inhella proteolytica TaxID=2795029 RepID=UPI001E497317|nr:hypothetical protein [Inhella proteolytica]